MSLAAAMIWATRGGADHTEQLGDVIDWLMKRVEAANCEDLIQATGDDLAELQIDDPCQKMIDELRIAQTNLDRVCEVVQSVIARLPDWSRLKR
jgi:hypothetical protein